MHCHKAVRGSRLWAIIRIRSVVIDSDWYHSEVGRSPCMANIIGAKQGKVNNNKYNGHFLAKS